MIAGVHVSGWGWEGRPPTWLLGLFLVVGACEGHPGEHPDPRRALEQTRGTSPQSVVATVGGRELGLREFEAYWRRRPDLEAEEVVERVVEREIAVQRALDEEVDDWTQVGRARKRARVQQFLETTIEEAVPASELPDEDVRAEVERLRRKLRRPAGFRASQIVAMVPERHRGASEGVEQTEGAARAAFDRARDEIGRVRAELDGQPSLTALYRARRQFVGEGDGTEWIVNANLRFPDPSDPASDEEDLRTGWLSVAPPLARAARDLASSQQFGVLSEPVRTRYGWHLIVVHDRLPAKVPRDDELKSVATARLLRRRRSERLAEHFRRWRRGHNVTVYPEAIDRVAGGGD